MSYSAGTLDLAILGVSNSAILSIDKTVKSLNSLSRAINKINNLPVLKAANNLSAFFTKLAASTNSINTANITNLAMATKSLSSLTKITKLNTMNWGDIATGFTTLTTAITPFIDKVKNAETSLNALYGILNKSTGKKIGSLLNNITPKTTGKSPFAFFKGFLKAGAWIGVLHTAKRIGGAVAQIVQKGSNFGETLNLWKVSMGEEFLPQATEFVNKLNEAYGISKSTLMNSQAIFKNMLGSLGELTNAQAYAISEGVTQMALDYASLYNVTFDNAMKKFQAALSGQVRPIRSVSGYDITETTLYEVYKGLGGAKTMRQLTQTEKRLLSIYAIFQQMERSNATGDLERTINSYANQSRVFADSWKDIQTYAGLVVTRLVEKYEILQKLNAVLIFASRLLEGIATSLDTGLGNTGLVFEETEGAINDTTDAVENLKSSLLDFDKFRALDQSSGNNALGIDQTIVDALNKYDGILDQAELKARAIADSWLASLGFIDQNNDGILDMQGNIDAVFEKLNQIKWGEVLGKKVGEFINWIDFADLTQFIIDAIDNALSNTWDFIVNLVLTIDWKKLGEEFMEAGKKIGNTKLFKIFQSVFDYWAAGKLSVPEFAAGGLPDKGTLYVAGEAGAEIVYNMPSGQSGVANIQQIASAMYSGTMRALSDWWGGSQAKGDIPQLREASATGLYEAVTGTAQTYGKVWSNV
jgi:hypothetical protein